MTEIEMSSVGIIALVPDRWGDMWQARHHLLSRIAQQCHVAWMNPAHHWRSIFRTTSDADPAEAPGEARLRICDAPLWLPRFHAQPRLDNATLALRLQAARKSLLRAGATRIVLYIWRPEFASALNLVPHQLSCYHVDDEYSFSATSGPIPRNEMRLLKEAGQVFIHSETMLRAKGNINPHTAHIPNGVAERHPEWSFVFVGPMQHHHEVEDHVARLRQLPNVYILGGRPTSALHAYVQHFDVCVMPYAIDRYTHFIYPVKVHEYLATGNPVVASPLPNLREFEHVLLFAGDVDAWSYAIARALATRGDEQTRHGRRAVARRHDWSSLASRVTAILQSRLERGTAS
jgi:hypothetical protein